MPPPPQNQFIEALVPEQLTVGETFKAARQAFKPYLTRFDAEYGAHLVNFTTPYSTPTPLLKTFERRKLLLSCLLMREPKVLLMDEPAAGLINAEIDQILRMLSKEMNVALLIVEHRIELLESITDRVIVMDAGVVIAQTGYKVPTYLVGRLKHYVIWSNHGDRLWNRTRWWPTRRNLLHVTGIYNRKTAIAEKKILDRRPIYWLICLVLLALAPLVFPASMQNTLLTAGTIFGIFAAINVCWTLIIGTASIFSLASYAVVGTAAFLTSWLSITYGVPWYVLPLIGSAIGLVFGLAIALPALRLDGLYHALLTLGLFPAVARAVWRNRVSSRRHARLPLG